MLVGGRECSSLDDRKDQDQVARKFAGTEEETCIEKLAQLFPHASPVRIPVKVTTLGTRQKRHEEQTTIEFGTQQEVLFRSALPLEFEDQVRLANVDGSLDAQATVVAVRYHGGQKAIAARFAKEVGNWIIKS